MATTVTPAGAPASRLLAAGRAAAPPLASSRARAGRRSGPFDSVVNLVRMTLAIIGGMVLGAFICAALGF